MGHPDVYPLAQTWPPVQLRAEWASKGSSMLPTEQPSGSAAVTVLQHLAQLCAAVPNASGAVWEGQNQHHVGFMPSRSPEVQVQLPQQLKDPAPPRTPSATSLEQHLVSTSLSLSVSTTHGVDSAGISPQPQMQGSLNQANQDEQVVVRSILPAQLGPKACHFPPDSGQGNVHTISPPLPQQAISAPSVMVNPKNPRGGSSVSRESQHQPVDQKLWHACAGGLVQLPPVDSQIIYWPQGHLEACMDKPDGTLDSKQSYRPATVCKVQHVEYLADSEGDDVFARIYLLPEANQEQSLQLPPPGSLTREAIVKSSICTSSSSPGSTRLMQFAKTLTQSDALNGGGFSVPRYCAESIFPQLDYHGESPPRQTLVAWDVHGEPWKFRHIYRGTPKRHLLTTGWSSFVNAKKLRAGDAVTFVRNDQGRLCVGIRRAQRQLGCSSPSHAQARATNAGLDRTLATICQRIGFTAASVQEAVTQAEACQPFEIIFFPRVTAASFCVGAQPVLKAIMSSWAPGARFSVAYETDDLLRTGSRTGTIIAVKALEPTQWPNSLWRSLAVKWDDENNSRILDSVSPWECELLASNNMAVQAPSLPAFSSPGPSAESSPPPGAVTGVVSSGSLASSAGNVKRQRTWPLEHESIIIAPKVQCRSSKSACSGSIFQPQGLDQMSQLVAAGKVPLHWLSSTCHPVRPVPQVAQSPWFSPVQQGIPPPDVNSRQTDTQHVLHQGNLGSSQLAYLDHQVQLSLSLGPSSSGPQGTAAFPQPKCFSSSTDNQQPLLQGPAGAAEGQHPTCGTNLVLTRQHPDSEPESTTSGAVTLFGRLIDPSHHIVTQSTVSMVTDSANILVPGGHHRPGSAPQFSEQQIRFEDTALSLGHLPAPRSPLSNAERSPTWPISANENVTGQVRKMLTRSESSTQPPIKEANDGYHLQAFF